MAEHQKHDSGKGIPASGEGKTTEPHVHDSRLIPGGSLQNARTPVGMNAFDRLDYEDTPETDAERPAHAEEPGGATSTATAPGIPRP